MSFRKGQNKKSKRCLSKERECLTGGVPTPNRDMLDSPKHDLDCASFDARAEIYLKDSKCRPKNQLRDISKCYKL